MKIKKILLTSLLSAAALTSSAQFPGPPAPSRTPDWANVDYAGDGQTGHLMDIYSPDPDGRDTHPLIVLIYGSAWFGNDGKGYAYASLGEQLRQAGFTVASINHRSSPEARYPAQINDVKGAIRYLRANADKYAIDTTFVGITGFSSGGHLSSMAGVTNGVPSLTVGSTTIDVEGNVGGNLDHSSSVNAVVDWFGPIDMSRMEDCATVKGADSPEAVLIGGAPADLPDMVALISPINFITPSCPPFIVIHGDADNVVPYCQGQYMSDALRQADRLTDFITVPGGGHGPVTFNDDTFRAMTEFFRAQAGL